MTEITKPKNFNIRHDWELFRSLETLCQKAGIPSGKLGKLVAKELTDNALDVSPMVSVGPFKKNGFFVQDGGPGLQGEPEEIASMFSISRALTSSKVIRLPTRGALGNGLRVVAGAVLCTGGELVVKTGAHVLRLTPKDNGLTDYEILGNWEATGTRIEVTLPCHFPKDSLTWAEDAIFMNRGKYYKGKTSPYWYNSESFFELLRTAAPGRTIRDVLQEFDGCSGRKAGRITQDYQGREAQGITRWEAEAILYTARRFTSPVKPGRLGEVGEIEHYSRAKASGFFELTSTRGDFEAEIPYIVEAWVIPQEETWGEFFVNRTPITQEVRIYHNKKDLVFFGGGLEISLQVAKDKMGLLVNVITPHIPITSDGKAPDFALIVPPLIESIEKSIRKMKRNCFKGAFKKRNQKEIMRKNLEVAINKASGGGQYRYSQRQLYYSLRPFVMEERGEDLGYNYFCKIITEIERERGEDIPGIFRDERGKLYHPHLGEEISLGTKAVENYERPEWTFNKILYSEKEGFFEILKDENWPEKYDCALLTSKGYASRAARDVIDLLGETEEEIMFFCIHDADGAGTMIYQTLVGATAARPGRRVNIINLGLDPQEGLEMGLEVEKVEAKKKRPVADYLPSEQRKWLQSNRIELNSMSTPVFLDWLSQKIEAYNQGKVIPPPAPLKKKLEMETLSSVREEIEVRIIQKLGVASLVEEELRQIKPDLSKLIEKAGKELKKRIFVDLHQKPIESWRMALGRIKQEILQEIF